MNLRLYYQGPFYTRIDKALLVAYIVSGAIVTLADYAAFTVCFSGLNLGLLVSTVTAYIAGLVVSYVLNRYWVYRKSAARQSEVTSLWRYIAFLAFNLGLTYFMLWAMQTGFGITPYIGKLVVNSFMFFWIYIGNVYWVFRGEEEGPIKL